MSVSSSDDAKIKLVLRGPVGTVWTIDGQGEISVLVSEEQGLSLHISFIRNKLTATFIHFSQAFLREIIFTI